MIHNLRIVAWNANSVSTKKAELDLFLHVNKIDIAAISETKLSPNRRFTIPGYTTIRSDRNQFGGGVMLIINSKICHDQYFSTQPHRTRSDRDLPLPTEPYTTTVRLSIPPAHIYTYSRRSRLHFYIAQLGSTGWCPEQ